MTRGKKATKGLIGGLAGYALCLLATAAWGGARSLCGEGSRIGAAEQPTATCPYNPPAWELTAASRRSRKFC
jgi:hypothetical protein